MNTPLKNGLMFACWLLISGLGLYSLARYAATPGLSNHGPVAYPSPLSREAKDLPMLLIFLHPKCSCSDATLAELAKIMEQTRGLVHSRVYFAVANDFGEDPSQEPLWQRAIEIPNLKVLLDRGGLMAGIFHSTTSGQAMLYSASGQLVFQGGITASRGHRGENRGEAAIIDVIRNQPAREKASAVYGCGLLKPTINESGISI